MNSPNSINPGPVFCAGNAKSIEAAQTTLPSMRGTLLGWLKPMIIGVVTTRIESSGRRQGEVITSTRELRTSGILLADEEKLEMGADGERSWAKWTLFVFPQLNVETDTRIVIKGQPYRVVEKKDRTSNGFIRYGLQEDYENA